MPSLTEEHKMFENEITKGKTKNLLYNLIKIKEYINAEE